MTAQCAVCGMNEGVEVFAQGERETYRLHAECPTCGVYEIRTDLWSLFRDSPDSKDIGPLRPYLAAHLRQATDAGELVLLTNENWRSFADGHRSTPVAIQMQKLLERIARDTNIGEWLHVPDIRGRLAASADIHSEDELAFVFNHLDDEGLIEQEILPPPREKWKPDGSWEKTEQGVRLTVNGWNAVAPTGGGVPNTVFVAMAFRDDLRSAYDDGIVPAVEDDCKLRVVRIDRVHHNENITNRIIASIRTASIVVADFTTQNQGVYYEAGFAEALGRIVIRTCRADDFHRLHFDTRQFFHIRWNDASDLRTKLAEHIQATAPRT